MIELFRVNKRDPSKRGKREMGRATRSILIITQILVLSSSAWAYLGGSVSSIQEDQNALSAKSLTVTKSSSSFSVYELSFGKRTIREYVSPSGTVFGVAWKGAHPVNLEQLLGNYKSDYVQARAAAPAIHGRGFYNIKGQSVVVQKWGPVRRLQGRAYAPGLIPQGVKFDEIN
jgi:hypothetical protein